MSGFRVKFSGQRAYRLDKSDRWVRIPLDIARLSVDEGRAFVRENGVDRCFCGCKYWNNGRCIDCGGTDVES